MPTDRSPGGAMRSSDQWDSLETELTAVKRQYGFDKEELRRAARSLAAKTSGYQSGGGAFEHVVKGLTSEIARRKASVKEQGERIEEIKRLIAERDAE